MLFNSYEFIFLFLPITLILYFTLNRFGKNELAKGWLVIASLYFYSYFNRTYLNIDNCIYISKLWNRKKIIR